MPGFASGNEAVVTAAAGVSEDGRQNSPMQGPGSPSDSLRTPLKDKRSLDYVLRSGLAGGTAGCAVGLAYKISKNYFFSN